MRHTEFSGSRIDQALLTHVIGDLSAAGSFDTSATSAIGSLSQLRTACRDAKERLSSANEPTLTAEVPGYRGEIRLTRDELDDAIRQPLDSFVGFFHNVLRRNGIRPGDLAAVASVGGGASIPLVTRTLSEQSGALVISAPRPQLTAAVGAALRASRGSADGDTALAPTALGSVGEATIMSAMPVESEAAPALAWSEADDDSGIMPLRAGEYDDEPRPTGRTSRARGRGELAAEPDVIGAGTGPWYRRPLIVAVGTALAVLAIGAGIMISLRHTSEQRPHQPVTEYEYDRRAVAAHVGRDHYEPGTVLEPDVVSSPTRAPASTTSQAPTTTTTTEAPTDGHDRRQTTSANGPSGSATISAAARRSALPRSGAGRRLARVSAPFSACLFSRRAARCLLSSCCFSFCSSLPEFRVAVVI